MCSGKQSWNVFSKQHFYTSHRPEGFQEDCASSERNGEKPKERSERKTEEEEEGDSDSEDDDSDLFVNTNRATVLYSESEEETDEEDDSNGDKEEEDDGEGRALKTAWYWKMLPPQHDQQVYMNLNWA